MVKTAANNEMVKFDAINEMVKFGERGTPALHQNEPADGNRLCCWLRFGLVLLLYLCDIRLFEPKKWTYFGYLRGRGCVESKNKTSAKKIHYELIESINNPS